MAESVHSSTSNPSPESSAFYRKVMRVLQEADVPFLVAGSYAFEYYTDISRHTKDFDVFIRRADVERAMAVLTEAGYQTEVTFPHWLAKVHASNDAIDLIFRSGNGISEVDDSWFARALKREVLGTEVLLCPPEEIIWTKAYIMERERFDGADVVHLIRSWGPRIDWQRMLLLFGPHWRVLLSHLILFGFIYPSERNLIPEALMLELLRRLQEEMQRDPPEERLCQGTLLSRAQYLTEIERWGYLDARLRPPAHMTKDDVAHWTAAIEAQNRPR